MCRIEKYKEKRDTKMAISVYNNSQLLAANGIDRSVLKEVSQEILKRAAEKNQQYNVHSVSQNSSIRNIGLDLYNGSVDNNTARQIAMNNSGLQIQLNQNVLNSIKYLNTQAAQSVQKSVEGKMTISVNEAPADIKANNHAPKFNSIISFSTAKDKNGSNPSYHGELLQLKKSEKTQEETQENIFNRIF